MAAHDGLESFFYRQAQSYLREADPPRRVTVTRKGGIAIVSVEFENSSHRVVVKHVADSARISSSADLWEIHQRVRASSPVAAGHLPRFLGFDEERRLVFVEFIPGSTLHEVLRTGTPPQAAAALAGTARVLSHLHRIEGASVGVTANAVRCNGSYVPQLERMWTNDGLARYLPPGCSLDRLLAHLPEEFHRRSGSSLIPVDCQPKNVIVTGGDRVVLVDIDYSRGNAAISIAAFLAGIDRAGIRRPTLPANNVEWAKRTFLEAYAGLARPEVLEDVVFFYPWCLTQMFEHHVRSRWVFRWYLERYYAARLRAFFHALERREYLSYSSQIV